MKIHLHIDRLILEGLPATSRQGPQIRSAIQEELTRLLEAHDLSEELRGGISVPRIRAGTMQVGAESQPVKLGTSIARAVHEGLGNAKEPRAEKGRLSSPGGFPK
jgi:hypothetical protein